MPDDKTDPREADEDQAKATVSPKAGKPDASAEPKAQPGADLDAVLAENAEIRDRLLRTIDHVPAEAAAQDPALKSFLEGVELTERELLNVLERHGVTRIDPLGQRFDPNSHQAMYEVQNADVPEGTVVDVMQSGYVIGD